MASGIYLNESVWSSPLVGYNKKQNEGLWTYVGKNAADHAIRSSVAITKLTLDHAILKKKNNDNYKEKEKCEYIFSGFFKTFWLSCSTYSIITGSGTQQVSFMETFCVKAGISCRFILY